MLNCTSISRALCVHSYAFCNIQTTPRRLEQFASNFAWCYHVTSHADEYQHLNSFTKIPLDFAPLSLKVPI